MEIKPSLPTVTQWRRDPDAATPPCPDCDRPLEIKQAVSGPEIWSRDIWFCKACDKEF